MQVPIHCVLIERNEDVDLVAHVADRPVARANCQESMAAADDRLVSVVGVQMQSAPRKDKRENVSSGSDPLAVLTANADSEINFVHYARTVFDVGGVNLLRRTLISKRRIVESVKLRGKHAPLRSSAQSVAWYLASGYRGRNLRLLAGRRSTRCAKASPPIKGHCRDAHQRRSEEGRVGKEGE